MKMLISLIVALACGAALAQTAPPPPATQPGSGTLYATRTIRITWSEMGGADDVIEFLTKRAAELAPQVVNGNDPQGYFRLVNATRQANMLVATFRIDLPKDPSVRPDAKLLANSLTASLREFLASEYNGERDRQRTSLLKAFAESRRQFDEMSSQATELRKRMSDLSGRADISPKTITESLTKLEDEKQQLDMDAMAKTARRDAIERQVADQSDVVQKKVSDDPIAAELQKAVDALNQKLELTKQQSAQGIATPVDVSNAIAATADARAKLLERKRQAVTEAGGDTLAGLSHELITLSIDLHELQARQKFVETHLGGLRSAAEHLDELQRTEDSLQQARGEVTNVHTQLQQLDARLDAIKPPRLVVTNSDDAATSPPMASGGRGGFGRGSQDLFGQ